MCRKSVCDSSLKIVTTEAYFLNLFLVSDFSLLSKLQQKAIDTLNIWVTSYFPLLAVCLLLAVCRLSFLFFPLSQIKRISGGLWTVGESMACVALFQCSSLRCLTSFMLFSRFKNLKSCLAATFSKIPAINGNFEIGL